MILTASVLDTDMGILSGVLVQELATGKSTMTDAEGKFFLNVSSENSQIRFSKDGYDYDTFSAADIIKDKIVYLYLSNRLSEVPVQNNYKKPDYTVWYVLAGVAAIGILYKMAGGSKPQPRKVKV